jgi:hypothetical protein
MPGKHYADGPKGNRQAAKDVQQILERTKSKRPQRAKELTDV